MKHQYERFGAAYSMPRVPLWWKATILTAVSLVLVFWAIIIFVVAHFVLKVW